MKNKVILFLSFPLAALLITVSCVGLFTPGFYAAETLNWQAQSVGQDMVDLFLVTPCLLITSVLSYTNKRAATMMWGGVVLYLSYTFVLYCFDVHFNKLFLLYCFCLGLSFYSFAWLLFLHLKQNAAHFEKKPATRIVGIYFIAVASLFYFLWLSEIIPSSIQNTVPKTVTDAGLFTNGVHVLDLAIILPGIFMTGIFLLKGKSIALLMAPVFLSFFILMDLTIGILAIVMHDKGIESDLKISVIMGVLALVSLALLIWFLKSTKPVRSK